MIVARTGAGTVGYELAPWVGLYRFDADHAAQGLANLEQRIAPRGERGT